MAVANRPLGDIDGDTNYATRDFIITSGVTVTAGDFVYFDGSGRITNSSIAGQRLVGMALETATGTSGSVTAKVCIDPLMRYLVDADNVSTTLAATHVGVNFDLTGATGAQLVDSDTNSTTGQLILVGFNPQIAPVADDTSWGEYIIAEHVFHVGTGGQ